MAVKIKASRAAALFVIAAVCLLCWLFKNGGLSSEYLHQTFAPSNAEANQSNDSDTNSPIVLLQQFWDEQAIDKSEADWRTRLRPPPADIRFDEEKKYYWHLETTLGPMTLALRPDWAPYHVTSTVYLTLIGYYDGLVFHRVISGFMAQFGCPKGDGTGNPGYQYDGEFIKSEARHAKAGILSTANAGPGTDGSQMFILFTPQPHLDGKHTVFGYVANGRSTLSAIENTDTVRGSVPQPPIVISRATVSVV